MTSNQRFFDALATISTVFILSISFIEFAQADCTINVNGGLGDPQTLVLKPTFSSYLDTFYWPSNRNSDVIIKENGVVLVACPGGQLILSGKNTGKESAEARCALNKFQVLSSTVQFNNIKCSRLPFHTARYSNNTCLGQHKEIEIGFDVKNYGFVRQMVSCFDVSLQSTIYTRSEITQHIDGFQYSFPRIEFIQGKFYSISNVNKLYVRKTQRATINNLLGLPSSSLKYVKNDDNYLSRGHFVAKADHVYGSQQLSTFYYVNAAPQWYSFNEGNWNTLEQSTRNLAAKKKLDLIVYSGSHGIATLPHESTKEQTKLYLYVDGNKRGIPVPQVYWRFVYDQKTKKGVAFVGVNNPYVKDDIVFCKSVCQQISWVKFNHGSADRGYTYCCEVDEIRKTITSIPDLPVSSLLL